MKTLSWVGRFVLLMALMATAYWLGRYDAIQANSIISGIIGIVSGFGLAKLRQGHTSKLNLSPIQPSAEAPGAVSSSPIGIVAFSFALRDPSNEPNPCNIRLAEVVERLARQESRPVVIVAQWEIAKKLQIEGIPVAHSVELRADGTYLDSDIVWSEAKEIFKRYGITDVIPVAQPFLQLVKIRMMLKNSSYNILKRKIGWIGFDKQSTQPWTRGPFRLFVYSIKQVLFGSRGHDGKQSA